MVNYLSLFLLIIFPFFNYAQKFGDIDIDMLLATSHEDEEVEAEYLLHNAQVYFNITTTGVNLMLEVHDRIKIYNDDGLEQADISIPFYKDKGGSQRVYAIKASTYNWENGQMTEMKLSKKTILEEESSKHWRTKKLAMQNVKPGSIIEIKYKKSLPHVYLFPTWFFQMDIPVRVSTYKVKINKYFNYAPVSKGNFHLEFSERSLSNDLGEVEYSYIAKNVPPFEKDEFVLSDDDYRRSIKFELHSTELPGRDTQYYSSSWKEISNNLLSDLEFGGQVSKYHNGMNGLVKKAKEMNEFERMKFLYEHVRDNFEWNKEDGVYCDVCSTKILAEKKGNSADINLLLINLLDKSGLDAHPVITKTRGDGVLNAAFPSLTEVNYVIAFVNIGENEYLMDATSKNVKLGLLPSRAVNISGIIVKRDAGEVMEFINPNVSKVISNTNYVLDTEKLELVGSGQQKFMGQAAVLYREKAKEGNDEEDDLDEEISDDEGLPSNEIEITESRGLDESDSDITLVFEEILREDILQIADEVILNAALDFGMDKNPFFEETREFPVFYSNRHELRNIAAIEIPEGYSLKSFPEPVILELPNKDATFMYEVKTLGKKVMINYLFSINTDIIVPANYPYLKEFYQMVVEKGNEKIVLTKN